MLRQLRLLLGISIFWLALSLLLDGINTLILPVQISRISGQATQATMLGLLTFIGLIMGAFVQPVAGAFSDRWKPVLGRKGFIGIGLALILISLLFFATFKNLTGIVIGYLLIQISASIAQAGQQSLIPEFADVRQRGIASGLKGFMDLTGAMLGFVLLGQLLGANKSSLALGVIAAILMGTWLLAALLTPEDVPGRSPGSQAKTISLPRLFRLDLKQPAVFKQLLAARFLFLLGVYAIGRFLLFFVAERLGLDPDQAAEQAGLLLGGLALITILASPVTGWLTDRFGRVPLMVLGAVLGAGSAVLLIWANSPMQILLFGSLMSLGSAAFGSGSWALLADIVPRDESARYFGLANFSTIGPTAAAGLLGPAIDWTNNLSPGNGYVLLFLVSAIAFAASILPLRSLKKNIGVKDENRAKDSPHASRLAVLSVPADPADLEKDHQDPPGGAAQL
jgi:NNP family nitrate/nitrite transporter-like MFS transporter